VHPQVTGGFFALFSYKKGKPFSMKTLLILRHAKSSWKDMTLADHDRPLKERGKRDAPRMGELLREQSLVPDLILSSTAKRALKTAELVADACGYEGDIEAHEEFYPGDPDAFIDALQVLPDQYQVVMVVGHNPCLEELLEFLTESTEFLPTAALAKVALPVTCWYELSYETEGMLIDLWLPRALQS
jgi:phosphohistidine phosphatase